MDQVLDVLNTCSHIGWKWALSEDAIKMVDEWIDNSTNVNNGKPYTAEE